MMPEVLPQHKLLQSMIGAWTFESACPMPDGTMMESKGREVVRGVGEIWVTVEMEAQSSWGAFSAISTFGYDARQACFVGTWAGSPMTHMFIYRGWLNDAGNVLTMESTGPDMQDPTKDATYRDVFHFISPEERWMVSHMKQADGSFVQFMKAVYRRVR